MTLVRFRYLHEQGIFNDRGALARAIDHYGFPKPMALGDNTLAWDLEKEVEPAIKELSSCLLYPDGARSELDECVKKFEAALARLRETRLTLHGRVERLGGLTASFPSD